MSSGRREDGPPWKIEGLWALRKSSREQPFIKETGRRKRKRKRSGQSAIRIKAPRTAATTPPRCSEENRPPSTAPLKTRRAHPSASMSEVCHLLSALFILFLFPLLFEGLTRKEKKKKKDIIVDSWNYGEINVYKQLAKEPLDTNALVCFKAFTVIHKLLQEGSPRVRSFSPF